MLDFTVYVDADHLPKYLEKQRYFGLNLVAAPTNAVDANQDTINEALAIASIWKWTLTGFVVVRIDNAFKAQANQIISIPIDLEPLTKNSITVWLDDQFKKFRSHATRAFDESLKIVSGLTSYSDLKQQRDPPSCRLSRPWPCLLTAGVWCVVCLARTKSISS